jgi:predicted RNA-binding Zn-ribbon protein involved in translation (DUF1610 family)
MAANPLDPIRHQINAGDRQGARTALAELLKAEPDNADAWALLAILLADPAEQARCYREILRINPDDRQAGAWLASLTVHPGEPPGERKPSVQESQDRECPRCGNMIKVNPLRQSPGGAIICPSCGFPVEPAKTPREEASIQQDAQRDDDFASMEPIPEGITLDQLLDQLPVPGTGDEAQHLERGPATPEPPMQQRGFLNGLLGRLRGSGSEARAEDLLQGQADAASATGALSPDLILRLAGGPLPPEERRKCPDCGAVVSRREDKCPWCSAKLPDSED